MTLHSGGKIDNEEVEEVKEVEEVREVGKVKEVGGECKTSCFVCNPL